jgi:hypothetical protein
VTDDNPTSVEIVAAVADGSTRGAIAALIEPVNGFLGMLLGPATKELGGWAGDVVEFVRWKWRVKMLKRAEGIIESAGLTAHGVPLQVLMPILDSGANEDRPDMQERWANLLANAATMSGTVPAAFPEILRQLEPIEARTLDYMIGEVGLWEGTARLLGRAMPGLDNANIDNMVRLALVRFTAEDYTGPGADIRYPEPKLESTVLAARFVAACLSPATSSAE